ncbi:MAG: S8 family serine peptidase, partial [Chloroflexota bacterium]
MSRNYRVYQLLILLLAAALFIGIYVPASAERAQLGQVSQEFVPVNDTDFRPVAVSSSGRTLSSDFKTLAASGNDDDRSIYIVRLQAPPVASYQGGIPGLKPTSPSATGASKLDMSSPESVAYTDFLDRGRANFINAMTQALGREVEVVYEYYAALNGLAVELTRSEVAVVADLPNVSFVEPDKEFELHTNAGPDWINADAIWAGVGGLSGTFGEGVIVGVIDTGINPDHPSFADIGGDGYDHTNPWGAGNYVGVCDPGDPTYDPTFPCNDKLIGAWGYPTVNGGDPVDPDGHGSHTASTAAGNFVFGASVNTPNGYVVTDDISGVAPHANVVAYAACCTGSALAAARDQVVIDGVDAVNYSIGSSSPTPDPWNSSFALQWLAVRDAGIFVATSAGNNGNGFATIGSPGDLPWLTTIGASTHDLAYLNSVINLSGGDTVPPADIHGRSVTIGYGPAPIVYAGDFGDALCLNPFPAGTFSGEIVVCDRGVNARVAKGSNIAAGGAGGMVLAEVTPGGIGALASDTHAIPAVHITDTDGDALKAWLASGSGHMATISGTTLDQDPGNADIMAKFSSRGVNRALPDIVKPDVTAPGVGIFAAYRDGVEYNIIQGTSMSSPHVAGAGALLKALHPDWTPAEIASALMSTADTTVVDNDGVTPADPYAMGAGRVDLANAGMAGLLLDETTTAFQLSNPADGGDPSALNLPSMGQDACVGTCSWTRTVENVLSTTGSWSAATTAEAGMSLSVSPSSFTLEPGETQAVVVTANLSGVPEGEWRFGHVYLTEDGAQAPDTHFPVAAAFSSGSLPDEANIITRRNAGSQLATDLRAIAITDLTIDVHGLAKGDVTEERVVSDPTNDDPYDGGFD